MQVYELLGFHAKLMPDLSFSMQAFIRISYAVLMFTWLLQCLPIWRLYFVGEKWGGYGEDCPEVNRWQNPVMARVIQIVWFLSILAIALGYQAAWASIINLVICHYYFVQLRWKSLSRGCGAPGFISYWLALAIFSLEATTVWAMQARSFVVLAIQVDFALIILSSGVSKIAAGYFRNEGVEYGMVNPQWGYWYKTFRNLDHSHWLLKLSNHLAWIGQITAAILFLIPSTRTLGGILIIGMFGLIVFHIRLGVLCFQVMLCTFFYFESGTVFDQALQSLFTLNSNGAESDPTHWVSILVLLYIIMRPIVQIGLWINFFGKKQFPPVIQSLLERYVNFFGIILWRVFSKDVLDLYIEIDRVKEEGSKTRVSRYESLSDWRFNAVIEAITVTCIFTALKYYSGNNNVFRDRLLRYCKTLPWSKGEKLHLVLISLKKVDNGIEHLPVWRYEVDPSNSKVNVIVLDEEARQHFEVDVAANIRQGQKPGSYVQSNT